MTKWKIFTNKDTGEEYARYTMDGTFAGEEQATKELLAYEHGISIDCIKTVVKAERKFKIKPQHLEKWGSMATEETVIDPTEVETLSKEWGVSAEELMTQLS